MGEEHLFGTDIHTLQTASALLPIDVIRTLLILKNALLWTDLRALTSLRTGSHLEDTRVWEARHYSQARLLGVVLPKMIQGTG